jgi:hypothetical protein
MRGQNGWLGGVSTARQRLGHRVGARARAKAEVGVGTHNVTQT